MNFPLPLRPAQPLPEFFAWPFLFAVLALIAFSSTARAQTIDWAAYCSASAKRVLLLVDITTPYDTQDKQILVDGLQSIVGKLGDGDSYTHTEKLIDRCMPYCPPSFLLRGATLPTSVIPANAGMTEYSASYGFAMSFGVN